MPTTHSFFEYSKQITEEFLSTAVIFDDQANFGDYNELMPKPKKLTTPQQDRKSTKKAVEIPKKTDKKNKAQSHDLNAKKVINSFAKKGIICSVIKPEEDELDTLHERANLLCNNVDLIIFDWKLSQSSGKTALSLVSNTIKYFNNSSPQQLRLIAIYTGEADIHGVFDKIKRELNEYQPEDIDERCCQVDACRLLIFAKKEAKTPEGVTKISFDDLADFLVEEYTKITQGILSNIVMKSFSVIKNNTHQILRKFVGLDYPFLTHRTCLPKPEEAEEQCATLVSEEIKSLLKEYKVGNISNLDMLRHYILDNIQNETFSSESFTKNKERLSKAQVLSLLEKGIAPDEIECPEFLSKNKFKGGMIFKDLTGMYANMKDFEKLDLQYAALTTLKSKYSADNQPYLTLGTIVQAMSNGEYWICMQPGCDSVRLSGDVSFPFLPVTDKGKIHCVLPKAESSNSFIRKKIPLKFSDCRQITFLADPISKDIKSMKEANYFFFKDKNGNKYRFICALKPEYAQRLSNKFAANISRVATNNSEWLRRCEEKNI